MPGLANTEDSVSNTSASAMNRMNEVFMTEPPCTGGQWDNALAGTGSTRASAVTREQKCGRREQLPRFHVGPPGQHLASLPDRDRVKEAVDGSTEFREPTCDWRCPASPYRT